ncbi:hypothetical protein GCM10009759_11470 [Kitasatospora saccharophila]|uniref:Uncharacterized protein n=1 Tax=Kitasatospora saccharophila TaxID=407973 RepID=A0ABP5HX49_9ACTN
MPTSQAGACRTWVPSGPPIIGVRTAPAVMVTGWWSAKTWSQPGMVAVGTNAEDAKTSGARTGNAAAVAVSGSPTARPTTANTQDIANPKAGTGSPPARNAGTPSWIRKPTRKPTPVISATTNTFRAGSAVVRPESTAERAVGSERKRSISPVRRSPAGPIAVSTAPAG